MATDRTAFAPASEVSLRRHAPLLTLVAALGLPACLLPAIDLEDKLCDVEEDCAGLYCVDGRCRRDDAIPHGARDAGASDAAALVDSGAVEDDAGAIDAGALDAGPLNPIDGGPSDAGAPDAGPVDAGPRDAGPLDAGPLDAGPLDAGPLDAGQLDAGPLDAGPLDAGPLDAGPLEAGPLDGGPPPVIITFEASAVLVSPGDGVTLTFASENATGCTLDKGDETIPTTGSVSVVPRATTEYTLSCTGPGGVDSESISIDVRPCKYECDITGAESTHDCVAPVAQRENTTTFTLDMSAYSRLYLEATLCDPTGFTLNVGDSPSNNGYGLDDGDTEHNAELVIAEDAPGEPQSLYVSKSGPPEEGAIYDYDFASSTGCTDVRFVILDQEVTIIEPKQLDAKDGRLLRIDPPTDDVGTPDALWYLAVNRVVKLASPRVGTGVESVHVCLW